MHPRRISGLRDTHVARDGIRDRCSAGPLRRRDVVFHELDAEALAFDPKSGAVHRFDATTLTVWRACDGLHSINQIAESLASDHAIDLHAARALVARVVRELQGRDLMLQVGVESPRCERAVPGMVESPRTPGRLPSRREVLGGGATKLLLTAPLISTFFAAGAYASGPSASAAFGPGGCKTVGYSCGNVTNCCDFLDRGCLDQGGPDGKECCVKHGASGCDSNEECCNATDTCVAGACI